jgi:hypothetical protein
MAAGVMVRHRRHGVMGCRLMALMAWPPGNYMRGAMTPLMGGGCQPSTQATHDRGEHYL